MVTAVNILVTIERLSKGVVDDYESNVVGVTDLQPIALWDWNNSLWEVPLKDLGFTREPLGVYYRKEVIVTDCFLLNECAMVLVEGYKTPVWYVHELQNVVQERTGEVLLNEMGRRLLSVKAG